ncbi:hypothetical protein ACWPM1_13810 [Tsuneonella sp. HG249]
MRMATSEKQRIVSFIRQQADHCVEVLHRLPDRYLIDSEAKATWMGIASALNCVADDIERGATCEGSRWS